jgi:hypothetical protein
LRGGIVVEDFHKAFDELVAVAWIAFAGGPGALLGLTWLVVAGIIAALVPLVAMAFDQFDSARDTTAWPGMT